MSARAVRTLTIPRIPDQVSTGVFAAAGRCALRIERSDGEQSGGEQQGTFGYFWRSQMLHQARERISDLFTTEWGRWVFLLLFVLLPVIIVAAVITHVVVARESSYIFEMVLDQYRDITFWKNT